MLSIISNCSETFVISFFVIVSCVVLDNLHAAVSDDLATNSPTDGVNISNIFCDISFAIFMPL